MFFITKIWPKLSSASPKHVHVLGLHSRPHLGTLPLIPSLRILPVDPVGGLLSPNNAPPPVFTLPGWSSEAGTAAAGVVWWVTYVWVRRGTRWCCSCTQLTTTGVEQLRSDSRVFITNTRVMLLVSRAHIPSTGIIMMNRAVAASCLMMFKCSHNAGPSGTM